MQPNMQGTRLSRKRKSSVLVYTNIVKKTSRAIIGLYQKQRSSRYGNHSSENAEEGGKKLLKLLKKAWKMGQKY